MRKFFGFILAAFLVLAGPAATIAQTLGPAPVTQGTVALFESVTAVTSARIPAATHFLRTVGYASAGDGGDALYTRVGSAPAHPGKVQSADGAWWVLVPGSKGVNARALGAKGDGATDDTTAEANTLAVALALNKDAYFPAGTYKITSSIDAGSSGADGAQPNKIIGDGRDLTIIQEATDNIPIVKLGGAFGYVRDLTLTYANRQTSSNTSAIGIEFYAYRWSDIERVKVVNAYRGEAIKQASVYSGANWISNVCMRDMYFQDFTGAAMYMSSYMGGSGGVCLENIYTTSRDGSGNPQAVDVPFYFQSFSEVVGNNIHVENSKPNEGFFFGTVYSFVLNGTHFENVTPQSDFGGLIHLSGSKGVINGTTIYGSSFLVGSTPNMYEIFRLDTGSTLTANGLYEAASTITTAHARQFNLIGGANSIFKRSFQVSGFTDEGSFSTPSEFKVRDDLSRPLTKVVNPDNGDASVTVTAALDAETQRWNTPLTANRSFNANRTGAIPGDRFKIVRGAGATGAFNLDVKENSNTLKTLTAAGQWCVIEYTYLGAWVLVEYGTL
jgi:hypothetical protein